jgi:AGCS family alanine or glycine:cation symporter
MENVLSVLSSIRDQIWGPVLIGVLLATGIFLTLRNRLVQIRRLPHAVALISGRYDDPKDHGEITHFQALSAALSATIGTGNIAGVATAIAAGGPGAVFWMWITGLFGMAIKYTSCMLGFHYRVIHPDGSISGGPMYYLERGLRLKWLGVLFALFAMIASFGIGNMVQANSVAKPLEENLGVPTWLTGLIAATLVALVIIGGIRRIGKVASRIVPFMCIVYVLGAIIIMITNLEKLPAALGLIFKYAFTPMAAGGGILGTAVREGVARGVFSNESGLGSAPIAHAAAKTKEPVREGLVAMVGPLVDTLIICTMTALVIVSTGAYHHINPATGEAFTSSPLSAHAFDLGLPGVGKWIVTFGLVFFAFSTMISWSYYGDRSTEYLLGRRAIMPYRWVFVALIVVGAIAKIEFVWKISDIFNGLMAFPNLVGIIGLSGVVWGLSRDYFSRKHVPYGKVKLW